MFHETIHKIIYGNNKLNIGRKGRKKTNNGKDTQTHTQDNTYLTWWIGSALASVLFLATDPKYSSDSEICWIASFCWDKCLSGSLINVCVHACACGVWGGVGHCPECTAGIAREMASLQLRHLLPLWKNGRSSSGKPKLCASLYHWQTQNCWWKCEEG